MTVFFSRQNKALSLKGRAQIILCSHVRTLHWVFNITLGQTLDGTISLQEIQGERKAPNKTTSQFWVYTKPFKQMHLKEKKRRENNKETEPMEERKAKRGTEQTKANASIDFMWI